jgi:Cu(I)/Ag(I) efflux system membrane fusion protein
VLGPEAGAFFVVAEGLEEGEEIAVNGVFKIDAASQLIGLPSMMNPEGSMASTGHDHGNMGSLNMGSQTAHTTKAFKVDKSFKKQLTAFYKAYLNLTEAFVSSNPENAQNASKELLAKLSQIDMSLLNGEAHMAWMDYQNNLESNLKSISKHTDIEEQRSVFAIFNLVFYKSLKSFGLDGVTTYYQYCPMADRDKGAYWFSSSEEIRNPYFGEAMLGCGENRETLK